MTRRPAGRPRGPTLTTDDVIDAAVLIAEQEGLAAVTVRALADRLAVGRTAIYHHAGTIDAVHDAVCDRVIAMFPEPAADPADWRNWYVELLTGVHTTLLRFNGVSQRVRSTGPTTPPRLAFVERATEVLLAAGFTPRVAALGYGFLIATTTGSVELRLAERSSETPTPADWAGRLDADVVGPTLAAVLPVYTGATSEALFHFAIATALDGLQLQLTTGTHERK